MKRQLKYLEERINALDAQLKAMRRQQDQLIKRRKQIQLQKAQQAVAASTQTKSQ